MALKEHPDYNEEVKRLKYTIDYIEKKIASAKENRKELRTDMTAAYRELNTRESMESYSRIMLNARLMDNLDNNYEGLTKARSKPYFSRIDFKHKGTEHSAKYYIGKTAVTRTEDNEPLVIDWRSPVASVYYDGMLGQVSYPTMTGIEEGELLLKRQYTINNGNLEDILDVGITTNDAFLQAALGEHKDDRLKDIVSTIQSEQNEIIRADIENPLVVQGAAGSGKTTIALHRIAYLIYTYEKSFDPDNFMIIAPNRLFLKYISEVLPELGVEHVRQTTFVELSYDLLGISYKLTDSDAKLVRFIKAGEKGTEAELLLMKEASQFKGSLEFKSMINRHVEFVNRTFVPNQDFCLENHILFTAAEIKRMVLDEFRNYPLYARLAELKKALSNRLKRDKIGIIKEVKNFYDNQIEYLLDATEPSEERRCKVIALTEERDKKLNGLKLSVKTAVAKYLDLFPKLDVMDYYRELLTNPGNMKRFGGGSINERTEGFLCSSTKELLDRKAIELEDLAPLLYLKLKLFGFNRKITTRYVVIDEAQDFSLFQLYALKKIFDTELFTIVGDLAQGIHFHRGVGDWRDVVEKVFTKRRCRYLTLEQSYRTTIEIMDAANGILKLGRHKDMALARPVVRHGDRPAIYRADTHKEFIGLLEGRVRALENRQHHTIALICKTLDECKEIEALFKKRGNMSPKLLSPENTDYSGGIVIVPSYLAKGLEFDAVIVASMEDDYTEKELDLKLLYVAMTRALHSLEVVCCKGNMALLDRIEKSLFQY